MGHLGVTLAPHVPTVHILRTQTICRLRFPHGKAESQAEKRESRSSPQTNMNDSVKGKAPTIFDRLATRGINYAQIHGSSALIFAKSHCVAGVAVRNPTDRLHPGYPQLPATTGTVRTCTVLGGVQACDFSIRKAKSESSTTSQITLSIQSGIILRVWQTTFWHVLEGLLLAPACEVSAAVDFWFERAGPGSLL